MRGAADVWADQARRFSDRFPCVRSNRLATPPALMAPIIDALHADDPAALIEGLQLAPCLPVGSSGGRTVFSGRVIRGG